MARKRETMVVDELAAIEASVANSRKTSKLVSRFAVYNERLGQDRSKMPESEAIEEARIEADLNELTARGTSGTIPHGCLPVWCRGSGASCSGCKRRRIRPAPDAPGFRLHPLKGDPQVCSA